MTSYHVDSDAVISTTAAVHASIGRIQAEVAGLHGHLANLQESWSGQAASAFQSSVAQWRATEQHVQEVLTTLNQSLGHAGQQYAEIEQANLRLFAR
ncbi:MAG: WXG100 family type VII secretion target [Microbacteriaceae bacterium]